MSDEKTLLEKITDAQTRIENPKFDATGQVGKRQYRYATLNSCLDAVNAAGRDLGLAVWFDIENNMSGDADRIFSHVVTVISDGKEETRRSPIPVNLNGGSQDNGSALTYAKRYSLCAAFGINADEDDDGNRAQTAFKANRSVVPKAPKQIANNQTNDKLLAAKGRLMMAIDRYAEMQGKDSKAMKEGITKRPDYAENANNPEWFEMVASEFESES